ncbi:Hybrid signal transduction histidine kinase K [Seminavis robusta]|uniref:histidine kinase n=1 Tax=Seminavis robusta TaxID=568900 RepID=A0A9N8E3I2_9STRA|nr:Hybrid signal transduction histidine kinase K [Seminavis robusta]|eukprot:Sro508_g156640.1 Hybrid signal transduction histidine kinase K (826) ;mRNA; f:6734-9211
MGYYGDLVNALCYTAFLPVYMYMYLQDPQEGALHINIAFALTTVFSWWAYMKEFPMASTLACLCMSLSIAGMNLYRWPHSDEVVVVPQFLWSLLVVSGNIPLPFSYKMAGGAVALANAIVVAYCTPLLSLSETLPTLLSAAAVFFGFHYYSVKNEDQDLIGAQGASLILAGTFAYHVCHEIVKMYAYEGYAKDGGFAILKAAFFAVVGLFSSDAFRKEIDLNETLDALVKVRTKEIVKQSKQLQIVEHALQSSETAMAITDPNRRLLWSNAALERLTMRTSSQLQNVQLETLLGTCDSSSWFRKEATHNDIVVNGQDITVEISPIPAAWEDQTTTTTKATTTSTIKNRKKKTSPATNKEQQPSADQEQFQFLVVLKNVTADKARQRAEKVAVQEAMAAQAMQESMQTLSHELRTPLQGIMGMTSMMLEESRLTESTAESLTVVMTSARLLLTLINNMLDVRKCDCAMMDEFVLNPLLLESALTSAIDFCRPFAGISGVNLTLKLQDDQSLLRVLSNELRFQQVMINLISNAIKYSQAGASVTVHVGVSTVQQAEETAKNSLTSGSPQEEFASMPVSQRESIKVTIVHVSDSGAGIPEEQRGKMFGRFSQLKTSPTNMIGGSEAGQPSGTGLGLNLCLKFVKKMNGTVWVNNNPDRGSTFSFYLPVALNDVALATPLDHLPKQPVSPKSQGSFDETMFQVLVVDDTIINLKVLERMLRRVGVGKVKTASSGEKALELLESENFNLVFTDLQMPHMDGIELTHEIFARYKENTRPIVVGLTAEVSESADQKCSDAGMIETLHKPITASQMKDFFDHLMSQPMRKLFN